MQYEKLLKSKFSDSSNPHPLYFHSFFAGDLFFPDPKTKFPPIRPKAVKKKGTPSQRELYRNRFLEKISSQDIPGKEHFRQYIRYKFRKNCKPNTIRGAFESVYFFLIFLRSNKKTGLDQLSRSDLEAFIEHEQDRDLKPSTLKTRLACLYAFIRYLVENKVVNAELLERKIHIRQPEALPRSIDSDDETKLLSVTDNIRARAMVLLLLRTGMRIGELLNTNMNDLNLEEQLVRINESDKTATGRVVYFSNDAAAECVNENETRSLIN